MVISQSLGKLRRWELGFATLGESPLLLCVQWLKQKTNEQYRCWFAERMPPTPCVVVPPWSYPYIYREHK